MKRWFPYLDIGCAGIAGGLWYLAPGLGTWPLLVAALPWGIRLADTGQATRPTPFGIPLALFLLTAGLGVLTAYEREAAWAKFWWITGAILLYYAFANTLISFKQGGEGAGPQTLSWLMAALGVAATVYFLATQDWDRWGAKVAMAERIGRAIQGPLPVLPGHRIHPNVMGGLLALTVPFAVSLQFYKPTFAGYRMAAGGLPVFIGFGLFMTTSRGAWLAVAAVGVAAGLWWLVSLLVARPARRSRFVAGLLLLAGAGVVVILLRPALFIGFLDALPGPQGLGRLQLYQNSLILVQDYPFLGAGLNSYMMLYSSYSLLIHVGFSVHAHNLFINMAIEQGLPALLLMLVMWGMVGAAWWKAAGKAAAGHAEGAYLLPVSTAALSIGTIMVHGLTDDILFGSRTVLLLFVPLAFAVLALEGEALLPARLSRYAYMAGFVILLLGALIWRGPLLSRWHSNVAAVAQSQLELSVYSWPEWPLQDEVRRQVDMSGVIGRYELALALDPANASANRRLGQIELSLGDYEAARRHLAAAYEAMPWDNATRQLYGEALIMTGETEQGAALWAGVDNEQAQLGAREFWYGHIGDAGRQALVQESLP